jgi:hypothetical protein
MEENWTEAIEYSDRAREELAEKESKRGAILNDNTQEACKEYRRQYNKTIRDLNIFMSNELSEAMTFLARLEDYVEFLKPQLDKEGLRVYRIANGGKVVATSPLDWPEKEDVSRIYIGSRWTKGIGPISKSYYLTSKGFGSHEKRRGEDTLGFIIAQIRGYDHFKRITSIKKILDIFCDFDDLQKWPCKLLPHLRTELSKRAKILRFVSEALLKG